MTLQRQGVMILDLILVDSSKSQSTPGRKTTFHKRQTLLEIQQNWMLSIQHLGYFRLRFIQRSLVWSYS